MIANILAFQAGWAVAVILGSVYAVVFTAAYLLCHHFFLVTRQREWLLIGGTALVGTFADSILKYFGVLDFYNTDLIVPMWLTCLWILFGTTLCHSLRWMKNLPWLAAGFAAIAGPCSYYAGARLNEVSLGEPVWVSLLVLSLWWGSFFPLVMKASKWVGHE